MSDQIEVFVSGIPKAQPRVRAFSRGGRAGVYDPGTADPWKALIALAFGGMKGALIEGALEVDLEFYLPRPKSHFGTGRNAGVLKKSAPIFHTKKPDKDNLEKAVLDTLSFKSGIGVWHDDAQIVGGRTSKDYEGEKGCGAMVRIRPATPKKPQRERSGSGSSGGFYL